MKMQRQNTTCYMRAAECWGYDSYDQSSPAACQNPAHPAFGRDEGGALEAVEVALVVAEDGSIGRDYGDGVEWYSVTGTITLRGWGKDNGEAVVLDSPRPLIVPSSTLARVKREADEWLPE